MLSTTLAQHTALIIPAYNEEDTIGKVVRDFVAVGLHRIIVSDNGSTDSTGKRAKEAGATVVLEPSRGYGSACLAGIAALGTEIEFIVFADGDGGDDAQQVPDLLAPLVEQRADLVVASRHLGAQQGWVEKASLTLQQRIGNQIASRWLRQRFQMAASDLGPYRAIGRDALQALKMQDKNYGWTVEMQIKAARFGLRYAEIPARYRRRQGGISKVSGSLRGSLGAGAKILGLLAYYDFWVASQR